MKRKLLIIHEKDNVGVILENAEKGDHCACRNQELQVLESIEFAHKVALDTIPKGSPVFKYGEQIGYALEDIPAGSWLHNHNMGCDRGK